MRENMMNRRTERAHAARPVPTKNAVQYFDSNSELWAERYRVRAGGDLLWARHRAIVRLFKELKVPKGSRVLDLGSGLGFLDMDLAKLGYTGTGIDAAPFMVRRSLRQAQAEGVSDLWRYQVGDVEALPFRDASFDAAACAGVIEYLSTDGRLLAEVKRVLRPGGNFILAVTNAYGYTECLSSLADAVKGLPGMVKVASSLRRIFVGGELGVMQLPGKPRKLRPSIVRAEMRECGFEIEVDKFVQFTLLPAPFCALTSRLGLKVDDKLGFFDRTWLRLIGSSYILGARLAGGRAG